MVQFDPRDAMLKAVSLTSAQRTAATPSPTILLTTTVTFSHPNIGLKLPDVSSYDKTCGYVALNSAPITCPGGYGCYTWVEAGVQGCCNTRFAPSECIIATTCVPFSTYTGSDAPGDALALSCTSSAYPYCAKYQYLYDGSTILTQHFCDDTPYTISAYPTTSLPPMASTTTIPSYTTTTAFANPTGTSKGSMPTGRCYCHKKPSIVKRVTDFTAGAAAGGAVGGAVIAALLTWW
jgi:hypothetical protein